MFFKNTVVLWITCYGGGWVLWGIIVLLILMVSDYDSESNGESVRSDLSRVWILIRGNLSLMNLSFLIHKYR